MTTIRNTQKRDIRIRVPAWVAEELHAAAQEAGVSAKHVALAAGQLLEDWAKKRREGK
jgi:hypothetical protein